MSRALWWVANGRAAAPPGERLHDRRLDLQEPARVQEGADRLDDARPEPEDVTHAGIDQEIDVALAVPGLDVLEPVPLLRQRPHGLREERPGLDLDGELARAGAHQVPGHPDEVRHVQVREARVALAEDVGAGVELDRARLVEEVGEAGLAVVADRHDAPGDADRSRAREARPPARRPSGRGAGPPSARPGSGSPNGSTPAARRARSFSWRRRTSSFPLTGVPPADSPATPGGWPDTIAPTSAP